MKLPRVKKKLLTDLDTIFISFMYHLDGVALNDIHRLYYRRSIPYSAGLPGMRKHLDNLDDLVIPWLVLAREASINRFPDELEDYTFYFLQSIYQQSIKPYTEIISKLETIYHQTFSNYAECVIDFSELDLISLEIKKNRLLIRAIEEKYLFIKQKLENNDELLEYEDGIENV